jgi:hypothetical protein
VINGNNEIQTRSNSNKIKTFSQYHFNCGGVVLYTCGKPILKEDECPILGNEPDKIEHASLELCDTLISMARKRSNDIYSTVCSPSGSDQLDVISYNKYDSKGKGGKKCDSELGCVGCWDERVISAGGGIKDESKYTTNNNYNDYIKSDSKHDSKDDGNSETNDSSTINSDALPSNYNDIDTNTIENHNILDNLQNLTISKHTVQPSAKYSDNMTNDPKVASTDNNKKKFVTSSTSTTGTDTSETGLHEIETLPPSDSASNRVTFPPSDTASDLGTLLPINVDGNYKANDKQFDHYVEETVSLLDLGNSDKNEVDVRNKGPPAVGVSSFNGKLMI